MKYEIQSEIGRGAMGVVYRARDRSLDRVVALKCMQAALVEAEDRKRFAREMKVLAGLRHRRIVRLLDASLKDDAPYIAMELVPGQSLGHRLLERPLDVEATVRLLAGILDGVAFLHHNGCWHGDLKPSNVILAPDGPVLIDFGLSSSLAVTLDVTKTRHAAGTPSYIAPELLFDPTPTESADVFSVAVIGHECLVGCNLHWIDPNTPPAMATILTSLTSGSYLRTVERQLARFGAVGRVLIRALDPDPGRRPGDATALSQALVAAIGGDLSPNASVFVPAIERAPARDGRTAAVPLPPRAAPAARPAARHPSLVPAALAASVLAGLGAWAVVPRPAPPPPVSATPAAVPVAFGELDATLARAESLVDGRDQAVFTRVVEAAESPEATPARAALEAMLDEAKLRQEQIEELVRQAGAAESPEARVRLARAGLDRWRLWHAIQRAAHLDFMRFAAGPGADRFATLLDDPAGQYPPEGISIEERALTEVSGALEALGRSPRASGPHVAQMLLALRDVSYRGGFFLWPPDHRERAKRVRGRFVNSLKALEGELAAPLARVVARLWEAYQPDVRKPLKPGELSPDLRICIEAMPGSAAGLRAFMERLERQR